MRRQVYLNLPGFPAFFQHMYEEPDYAAQSYAAGYGVWFEPSLEIFHRQSTANRHVIERHQLNARNEFWSVCLRCPWPWLPAVTVYRAVRQMAAAFCLGPQCVIREPFWWWEAFKGFGKCMAQRHAIPWKTYYRWMRLARSPIDDLRGLRAKFPTSSAGPAGLIVRRGPRLKPQLVAAADRHYSR
jgi:GT2 family glycosyltransferase